jgi:signal transduction histidine kinase
MASLSIAQIRTRALLFAFCLFVPMAFLWFNYLHAAYQGILEINNEMQGMEIATMIHADVFHADKSKDARLRELADAYGIKIEDGLAKMPGELKFRELGKLQAEIARKSGLIVDGDARTHYLISAGFVLASEALDHFATAASLTRSAVGPSHDENSADLAPLLLAAQLGASTSLLDLAGKELLSSCDCEAAQTADYLQLKEKLQPFRSRSSTMLGVLTSGSKAADVLSLASEGLTNTELSHVGSAYDSFFNVLSAKVSGYLALRKSALWRSIVLISLAGVAVTLVGLSVSVNIFKNSVDAQKELSSALTKSETEHARTQLMNDEIGTLNNDLAGKIVELQKAQSDLLDKSRFEQLGQLTATVAHEIRNPMGAIRTSAFLVSKKLGKDNELVGPQLARINSGIERCDSIITQLLDFSRTRSLDVQTSNLDDWLIGCLREETEQFPKEINIQCELGLENLVVPFDGPRLRRAVANVIHNAADALKSSIRPADGAPREALTIWISTSRTPTHAQIEIRDNGPGIASDVLPKILDPLFTTKSFGTGLGLPAAAQVARLHGGKLQAASELGKGAKFTISIALNELTEPEPKAA